MPWLELSLTLRADQQTNVEAALDDLGALSVTLLDAENHPIFEPDPGETPVWPTIALRALFAADVDRAGVVHVIEEFVPELGPADIAFELIEDQDWERAWMDQFRPMAFGRRLWIYPWNVEPPDEADLVVVRLDPGLAFGTGTHPTTALCLEWLDGTDLVGKTVVDYGCGSGVLAIAALKLGAARALGIDNDPQALTATADNATRNDVADRLVVALPDEAPREVADVLVANILAGPLDALAPLFAERVRPGGVLALSGILAGQEDELIARYGEWFDELRVATREDWVRIEGRRRER